MSRRARLLAAAACLGVIGVGLIPQATAQAAVASSEVYAIPGSGVLEVAGHGWGHGHGMSQWGANGAAAKRNLTGSQIAAFYYPGTSEAVLANSPIRVRVDCDRGVAACAAPRLSGAKGLTLTDRGTAGFTPLPLPTDRTEWRVKVDSAGYHLEGLQGTTWAAYPSAATVYKGPLDLAPSAGTSPGLVRVVYSPTTAGQVYREYRGVARLVRSGTSNLLNVVNLLGMEDYLLGVVPRESPSSWPLHALFAQAIAARSYSAYTRAHVPAGKTYDICDTTMCQVYWGAAVGKRAADGSIVRTALEPASTTKAVRCYATYYPKPTDGSAADPCSAYTGPLVRTYKGTAIFAQFSSSNGGWSTKTTSSNADVQAYLVAQQDPYDGLVASSVHSWSDDVSASTIEAAYRSAGLGTLKRLKITARDGNGEWGGRVQTVVLEGVDASGAATSVTTTGAGLKGATGLRSSWFKPLTGAIVAPTVTGPAQAARGAVVTLTGTSGAGAVPVDVWFLGQGNSTWARRTATAASDGKWMLTYTANVNFSYYAMVSGRRSATKTTTASGTTISGPVSVPKGTVVKVRGLAAPGWKVDICWLKPASTVCAYHSFVVADSRGGWYVSKSFAATTSYWARAAQKSSPVITTKVT